MAINEEVFLPEDTLETLNVVNCFVNNRLDSYLPEDKLKTQNVVNCFVNNRLGRDDIWKNKNIRNITGTIRASNMSRHYAFDNLISS